MKNVRAAETRKAEVLIAPLWNWNTQEQNQQRNKTLVLIAPLWNWNAFAPSVNRETNIGSNRTFMELKYEWTNHKLVIINSSNRTFMELK